MKAIILAAGVGPRLKRQLGPKPKCCAEVGGELLIERLLRLLRFKGVRDITVVLGYQAACVIDLVGSDVKFYLNPFYSITNSIASLWFARSELDGRQEVVILNGDLFFEANLLDAVIAAPQDIVMFADPRRTIEADYRFAYENGLLRRYGKDLSIEETTGEYIGVAKLQPARVLQVAQHLDSLVQAQKHTMWWEDVVFDLCSKGTPVGISEVTESFWAELDYIEDYQRVTAFLHSQKVE